MTEHSISLSALFDFVAAHLPEGWEFELSMARHDGLPSVGLALHDPEGWEAEVRTDEHVDDMDASRAIEAIVNHARRREGLAAVAWGEGAASTATINGPRGTDGRTDD
jgi:hypothetical protein